MIKRRARQTREQWATIIADFEASALSVDDYCQRHDLAPVTLHKWRRRLSADQSKPAGSNFTEVKPQTPNPKPAQELIRVEVGSAITLTIQHEQ